MASRGSEVDRARAALGLGLLFGLFLALAVSIVSFNVAGQLAFGIFGVVSALPVVGFEWRLLGSRRACLLDVAVAAGATTASFLSANAV